MRPHLLVLLAAAACRPEPALVLDLPAADFRLADTTLIVPFTARNQGTGAVWVDACDGRVNALVERWDGVRWQAYSSGACVGSTVPMAIPAGAAGNGGAAIQRAGVFHFVVGLHDRPPGLAPTTAARSAPFAVH